MRHEVEKLIQMGLYDGLRMSNTALVGYVQLAKVSDKGSCQMVVSK